MAAPGSDLIAVVAGLVAGLRDDPREATRRWPKHPLLAHTARELAAQGRLYVHIPIWCHSAFLDAAGEVQLLVEVDVDRMAQRPANALEAHYVWQRSVACDFPELAPFVPRRGTDAVTCPSCKGTGFAEFQRSQPGATCFCGNAGWLPPGSADLPIFPP